jgi:D-lactate dehydrogenase
MKVVRFSSFADTEALFAATLSGHEIIFVKEPLNRDTASKALGADAVSVFVDCDASGDVIALMPTVKCIVTESTGTDHIDLAAAKARSITIKSVPGYGAYTVAEFTFALLLMVTRRMYAAAKQVKETASFDTHSERGMDLHGKTIAVVGTGRIGKHVIEIARGFGMRVLAYDTMPDPVFAQAQQFTYGTLDSILAEADVISLHVPYMPETHHMISAATFSRMKRGAILINTARGELVDTLALVEALSTGQLGGAGLDVIEGERSMRGEIQEVLHPSSRGQILLGDHVLMQMGNVVVTPHIAFHTKEADEDRVTRAALAIKEFAASAPTV